MMTWYYHDDDDDDDARVKNKDTIQGRAQISPIDPAVLFLPSKTMEVMVE
jgi:hypothetical protein